MDTLNRGNCYNCNGKLTIDLVDDYEHIDDNIEYVVENVLQNTNIDSSSYKALYEQFNAFIARKCECECDPETEQKVCSQTDCFHGGNYIVYEDEQSKRRELILNEYRKSQDVIYECSEFCSCPQHCYNRLVQFGPRKDLKIEDFSQFGKQYGLTTLMSIPKGAFVCEYAGEILCKGEALRRHQSNDANQRMNYIICLNERPIRNVTSDAIQTFIDPSRIGNIGRYLNHSCDPNCEIISVRVDGIIPKLCKILSLI